MRSRTVAALAAISLMVGSSAAMAQSAQPLSLNNARAGAVAEGSDLTGRGPGFYIIGAIVLGLVIWGIIELTSDNETDTPSSP